MAKPGTGEFSKLRNILSQAKNIVVLSGAGISAESGVPTFRGAGGLWRKYQSTELATPEAFKRSPSLVWEFYQYRRELVLTKQPNKAHIAIAEAERALQELGRSLTVVTQNVDGLHQRAGSQNVIELHGSLYKTRCLQCGHVAVNTHSPIVPALADRGAPEADFAAPDIPESELPRCKVASCGGLLRPHIVWFGENLDPQVLAETEKVLERCDACLLVGTSSLVYPAAMYAPSLASKNIPVAEFNIESTPATHQFMFHLQGPCTQTLPLVLSVDHIAPPLASEVDGGSEGDVGESMSREDGTESRQGGSLSLKQKLKMAMRDYGSTVIVFHIGHSLTLLGIIYLALSSGLDLSWFLDLLGLSQSSFATGASTFVIAYAVNKVLAPLRISITLGATPFIVRYLRKIGFLKPVNK